MTSTTAEKESAAATLLAADSIHMRFGRTHALRGVSLAVRPGEVVALLGENGAGKSTLVRCLSGETEPHEGHVSVGGSPLEPATPHRAAELGVAVIHQELSYIGTLSVAENMSLGRPPRRSGFPFLVDHGTTKRRAREALAQLAPHLDVRREMSSLRVADRQLVEIARAISTGAQVILMDEPTAALNASESERLFEAIHSLRQEGLGIVYISHRLDEVLALADRLVILRDGSVVGEHDDPRSMTEDQLIDEIVGRELERALDSTPAEDSLRSDVRLSVQGLGVPGSLDGVDVDVRVGEVVGFYGLAGSGVEHIAKAVVGATNTVGQVLVDGVPVRRHSPSTCREAGVVLVPADRRAEGIFPGLSIATNVAIGQLANRGSARLAKPSQDHKLGRAWIKKVDIRPADSQAAVGGLSGGNQQKSIFARWLATNPRVLVLDEPTRGVDVGAKAQMYTLIDDAARVGTSAVVVSSEAAELLALCHRIVVIRRGRIVEIFNRASVDEQRLVAAALGASS